MIKHLQLDLIFFTETWLGEEHRIPFPLIKGSYAKRIAQTGRLSGGICYAIGPNRDPHELRIVYESEGLVTIVEAWGLCICCVYIPPDYDRDRQLVADAIHRVTATGKPAILLGDWNARNQDITGDTANNARGQWLFPMLSDAGMRHVPSSWGAPTFVGRQGNSIVDLVFASNQTEIPEDSTFIAGDNWCASDHKTIYVEALPPGQPHLLPQRESIRLERLKDPDIVKTFQDAVGAKTAALMESIRTLRLSGGNFQNMIDQVDSNIRLCLESTAKRILGTKKTGGPPTSHDRFVEELRHIRNQRWRDLERATNAADREHLSALYIEAKSRWKEATELFRRKEFEDLARNMDRMDASEVSKSLRKLTKTHLKIGGTRLNNSDASLEECRVHFETQFGPRSSTNGPELCFPQATWRGHLITRSTLLEAIKRCGNGKAPGRTGHRAELFKVAAEAICDPIKELFQMCLEWGLVPSSWKEANIIPIPKKPGADSIKDHRPISLTEHLRKLFEKTILHEVIRYIEPLGREQGGFRARRSTLDQAAALHETLLQHKRKHHQFPCVAYLDVTAAYDSVPRHILWNLIRAKGMPGELLNVLQALFDNCTSRVVIGGKESLPLFHQCGLLQGSSLSPVLYSAYINGVADEARKLASVTLNGEPVATFLYADDIAVVAKNEFHLQNTLDSLARHSNLMGFQFNPKKCEVVAPVVVNIRLYGARLQQSDTFKYLGVDMNSSGIDATAMVTRNVTKARAAIGIFVRMGFRAGGLLERTKVLLYKLFIRPKLEYGLAILPHIATHIPAIEQVQYFALRTMLSMPQGYPYSVLRVLAACPSMKERIEELRGGWFLRVERCAKETFMIGLAYGAFRTQPTSRSVFWTISKNPLVLEVRKIRLTTTSKVRPKSKEVALAKQNIRVVAAMSARAATPFPSTLRLEATLKPTQLYQLGNIPHRKKQMLLRWIGGKAICLPTTCPICQHKGAQAHWLVCYGLQSTSFKIQECQFLEAFDEIAGVVELYHALKTPDSRDL